VVAEGKKGRLGQPDSQNVKTLSPASELVTMLVTFFKNKFLEQLIQEQLF